MTTNLFNLSRKVQVFNSRCWLKNVLNISEDCTNIVNTGGSGAPFLKIIPGTYQPHTGLFVLH